MRRATLQLFIGVIAFHAVALAVYYFAGIEHKAPKTRQYFTVGWTVLTLFVVLPLLKRIRNVRYKSFRA